MKEPILVEKSTMEAIANAIRIRTEVGERDVGEGLSIYVTAPTGSTVTAIKDGETYTADESTDEPGTWKIIVPDYGTYGVTAELDGEVTHTTITIEENEIALQYAADAQIFGVMWDRNNPSTELTRLTIADDPNHLVTVDITEEPEAAVGSSGVSSPFDWYAPWKDMAEYNISGTTIGKRKGQTGFSRITNDTMVFIPEFWYKVIDDSAERKRYWYIADNIKAERNGFTKHPGSGRYVGRYNTGAGYVSKSNLKPLNSISRLDARNGSAAKGEGWYQYDAVTRSAVQLLYLVEWADWDAQSKIGKGIVEESTTHNTGETDAMSHHTGRAEGDDGHTAVQYRWIENPWGNIYDWMDGININDRAVYMSVEPEKYADDTALNYVDSGLRFPDESGYIKEIGYSETFPWAFIPIASSGSETTYIPDLVYQGDKWRGDRVGGSFDSNLASGMFCNYACFYNYTYENNGSRLIFIPKEG